MPLGKKKAKEYEPRPTCTTCPGMPAMKTLYERVGASGQFVSTGIFMCPSCGSIRRR